MTGLLMVFVVILDHAGSYLLSPVVTPVSRMKQSYTAPEVSDMNAVYKARQRPCMDILTARESCRLNKKKPAATYFPAIAVSSALESLTSVFGMGTGITSPLWPPAFYYQF